MTHRERWLRTMHYQTVDHVPDVEFGYWGDTLRAWQEQGLPREISDDGKADRYFGFAPAGGAGGDLGLRPGFESKVIGERDGHRIVRDGSGVTYEEHTDGASSIPHYIDFPIKSRADWPEFKRRLNPNTPGRYPDDETWARWKATWAARDYPLTVSFGSLFGWLRNWMGFEGASMMMYDDPGLMHEMMEHLTEFFIAVQRRTLEEVAIDYGSFWEDMAFGHGPMISPKMFDEFLVPRYQRITEFAKRHGVDVFVVDCDGNINDVAGLWLKGGVNCMFPIEVAAGTDPVVLRRRWGKEMLLAGGVNKRALARGKRDIDAEIKRLEPLVAEGGFIPHVDHRVPPDVSFDNYVYYLKVKRSAFGIPEPPPWEERKPAS
jgi:uroporphyrinogen decarboxylase